MTNDIRVVFCPYCGAGMICVSRGETDKIYQYQCVQCLSLAPVGFTKQEAYEDALRRPLQKPGLYGKYTVIKNETGEAVRDCFVLKPMKDEAAVKALQAYAAATDDDQLRNDLYAWVGKPIQKPLTKETVARLCDRTTIGFDVENPFAAVVENKGSDCLYWAELHKENHIAQWKGFGIGNYGVTWRCWAMKPTDEERETARWEEPKHGQS